MENILVLIILFSAMGFMAFGLICANGCKTKKEEDISAVLSVIFAFIFLSSFITIAIIEIFNY